jgi:hypothetical protein
MPGRQRLLLPMLVNNPTTSVSVFLLHIFCSFWVFSLPVKAFYFEPGLLISRAVEEDASNTTVLCISVNRPMDLGDLVSECIYILTVVYIIEKTKIDIRHFL